MSELKPCPFCGWEFAEHAWNEFGEEYRVCDQCGASSGTVDSKWDWQNRPIEDALTARIAELEAEKCWVPVSERLPNKSGWYLAGLIGLFGGSYTGEVHFDTETGLPWRNSVRDEVYCWLDGVPELPQPPEVQE